MKKIDWGNILLTIKEKAALKTMPDVCAQYISLRYAGDSDKVLNLSLSNEIIIGRDKSCHIIIDDKSISRRHCKIYFNEAVMIENLSKTNVTLVNDNFIDDPVEIIIGDEIKIGLATLVVDSIQGDIL